MQRSVGLGVVLALTAGTLVLGLALKAPCANGQWHGQQYRHYCYSDIVPLYGTEHLSGSRDPYLDPCPANQQQCDEYPVLTMYAMRLAANSSHSFAGFFYANVALLSLAAFVTAICLYLVAGANALYFALAPTLLLYGYMNWDLLAVAFATAAVVAFFHRRDVLAGVLIGLGTAAKLYPALLAIPFIVERFRERDPDRGIHLGWAAAGTWLAVNLPFALLRPSGWGTFFRFNSSRPVDWDSLWFVGCTRAIGRSYCGHTSLFNFLSVMAFLAVGLGMWVWRYSRRPNEPRWTFVFPIVVAFLLTSKVYSPQYGLWLLPLYALALPDPRLFVAFSLADAAVFVTRFSFFGRYSGFGGLPLGAFQLAVAIRAAVLVLSLVVWATRERTELQPGAIAVRDEPAMAPG